MFCKTAGRRALKYVNAEVLKHDTGSMKLCDVQCPNYNRNSNSRLAQMVNLPAIWRIYWRLRHIQDHITCSFIISTCTPRNRDVLCMDVCLGVLTDRLSVRSGATAARMSTELF